tara:strand:- start:644 stop:874 length:231 start_codon:yes stop_codon:yes gene_type:complete
LHVAISFFPFSDSASAVVSSETALQVALHSASVQFEQQDELVQQLGCLALQLFVLIAVKPMAINATAKIMINDFMI